jgi:hypothetical protein
MPSRERKADDPTREARRQIIRKYGRHKKNGDIEFCGPSRLEREGRNTFHAQPNGKVIYHDREVAEKAAAALLKLTGVAFRPYACPRSKRGHHHLTEDRSPAVLARQRAERDASRKAGGR